MRWEPDIDLFQGLGEVVDFRPRIRADYERRIAGRARILDVGGRNQDSRSARRLRQLGGAAPTTIICTDLLPQYQPDVVDDITDSRLPDESFDAVYCDAILEHVQDYWHAAEHIRRILKPGGEVFIYVPFCWPFHDRMDFHRFTFTEAARLVEGYRERRVFAPDAAGYGGVVLLVLTFFQFQRLPRTWRLLSSLLNLVLTIPLAGWYAVERARGRWRDIGWRRFRFYFLHFYLNHGVCVWARK